jgi:1-acyl-sn-glycerol-3-phosphate acyltransferase
MNTTHLLNRTGRNLARLYAGLALELDLQYLAMLPAGAKVIAANHPTTTDPFLLMGLSDEPIHILITNMCFQVPVLGRFLAGAGHIPVVTGGGRRAFEAALALLRDGKTVGIFPEGALSPLDGCSGPAHSGVARLAIAAGVPVIPAGIALQREHIHFKEARAGAEVQTSRLYFGGPYAVTLGRPVYLSGSIEDHAGVRRSAEEVMGEIASLAQISARRLRAGMAPARAVDLVPALAGA